MYQIEKQDPDPDLYQIEKQDPDPDMYQIEKQDPDPYQKGLNPQHWTEQQKTYVFSVRPYLFVHEV